MIYDAAHAFKTEIRGRSVASFGDMTMFSFHATKLFHTLEGGALAVADPVLAKRIDMLKNFGFQNELEVPVVGINGKMNELQAAVGLVNLKLVDEERRKRAAIKAAYTKGLSGIRGLSVFRIPELITDSLQYFVIRVSPECMVSRDGLYEALQGYNVYTRRYFYPLCSDYTCYRHLPSQHIRVARQVSDEVLCLPLYGALSLNDVARIVEMIRFYAAPNLAIGAASVGRMAAMAQ